MKVACKALCLATAALACACGPDLSNLACQSSTECPSGYACDLGSGKCVPGASRPEITILTQAVGVTFSGTMTLQARVVDPAGIQGVSVTLGTAAPVAAVETPTGSGLYTAHIDTTAGYRGQDTTVAAVVSATNAKGATSTAQLAAVHIDDKAPAISNVNIQPQGLIYPGEVVSIGLDTSEMVAVAPVVSLQGPAGGPRTASLLTTGPATHFDYQFIPGHGDTAGTVTLTESATDALGNTVNQSQGGFVLNADVPAAVSVVATVTQLKLGATSSVTATFTKPTAALPSVVLSPATAAKLVPVGSQAPGATTYTWTLTMPSAAGTEAAGPHSLQVSAQLVSQDTASSAATVTYALVPPALASYNWSSTNAAEGSALTLTLSSSAPLASATLNLGGAGAVGMATIAGQTAQVGFALPSGCAGMGDGTPAAATVVLTDLAGNVAAAAPAGNVTCNVHKKMAVDPTRLRLVRAPYPDGTTRTTILGVPGAVSAAPTLTNVSLVASIGGAVVGSAPVAGDGSVPVFQLNTPVTQVALSVQDAAGSTPVPAAGYPEELQMSFVGKSVAGNSNGAQAFDVTTLSISDYAPQTWIASGPGPDGGPALEFHPSDLTSADGGVSSMDSYQAAAYEDADLTTSVLASATADGQILADGGTTPGTAAGWQILDPFLLASGSTPGGLPPRTNPSVLNSLSSVIAYGGMNGLLPADPPGTFYELQQPQLGWTQVSVPAGSAAPSAQWGAALGMGGYYNSCYSGPPPCVTGSYALVVAGGIDSTGLRSEVFAYGTTSSSITPGWFPLAPLPLANAAMASTPAYVPFNPNSSLSYATQYPAIVMAGGSGVTSNNLAQFGCLAYLPPYSSSLQGQSFSCTDGNFTGPGGIGMRSGVALTYDNTSGRVYLFGGNAGTTPMNDLWTASFSWTCKSSCGTTTPVYGLSATWTKIVPVGVSPPARAGAGLIALSLVATHRLLLYGGTDSGGNPLNDAWEFDPGLSVWRQVATDAQPALAPAARTGFGFAAEGSSAYLIGGSTAGSLPTGEVWQLSRQAVGRTLVKVPVSIASPSTASNSVLTIEGRSLRGEVYIWDGSAWRLTAFPSNSRGIPTSPTPGSTTSAYAVALTPGLNFVQTDGNAYLLLQAPYAGQGSQLFFDELHVTFDFQ